MKNFTKIETVRESNVYTNIKANNSVNTKIKLISKKTTQDYVRKLILVLTLSSGVSSSLAKESTEHSQTNKIQMDYNKEAVNLELAEYYQDYDFEKLLEDWKNLHKKDPVAAKELQDWLELEHKNLKNIYIGKYMREKVKNLIKHPENNKIFPEHFEYYINLVKKHPYDYSEIEKILAEIKKTNQEVNLEKSPIFENKILFGIGILELILSMGLFYRKKIKDENKIDPMDKYVEDMIKIRKQQKELYREYPWGL